MNFYFYKCFLLTTLLVGILIGKQSMSLMSFKNKLQYQARKDKRVVGVIYVSIENSFFFIKPYSLCKGKLIMRRGFLLCTEKI